MCYGQLNNYYSILFVSYLTSCNLCGTSAANHVHYSDQTTLCRHTKVTSTGFSQIKFVVLALSQATLDFLLKALCRNISVYLVMETGRGSPIFNQERWRTGLLTSILASRLCALCSIK